MTIRASMKKIALVGAGARALHMFAKPFAEELRGLVAPVGVYDSNPVRARLLGEACGIPVYDDFRRMLREAKPDTVLVASTDATHHTYLIAAMEAGCDVISEKPMTIDAGKCKAIVEAEDRTGRAVTVTFNMRFMPYFARVKELLRDGSVGDISHIALEWFLDRQHGADYFRRWHAQLANSGGLLVHKSTHHFDIVNWWLGSEPRDVHAFGDRRFYGPTREERGERCLTCAYGRTCELYWDGSQDDFVRRYYLQAEGEDGYIRDRCVFGEHIDIHDTMSVNVRYASGALLTYSLVAYSPVEGWKATITGSKGRMELANLYRGPQAELAAEANHTIRIVKSDGAIELEDVPVVAGGHGGGDERLRRMLFVGDVEDTLGQQAGSRAGAMSLLIGDAANRSIAAGGVVSIAELLR